MMTMEPGKAYWDVQVYWYSDSEQLFSSGVHVGIDFASTAEQALACLFTWRPSVNRSRITSITVRLVNRE